MGNEKSIGLGGRKVATGAILVIDAALVGYFIVYAFGLPSLTMSIIYVGVSFVLLSLGVVSELIVKDKGWAVLVSLLRLGVVISVALLPQLGVFFIPTTLVLIVLAAIRSGSLSDPKGKAQA